MKEKTDNYIRNEKGQKRFYIKNLLADKACKDGMTWYVWLLLPHSCLTDVFDAFHARDLAKNHPDWLVWAVSRDYACEGAWELGREELRAFWRADWNAPNGDLGKCHDFYLAWYDAILAREKACKEPPCTTVTESPKEKVARLEKELAEAKRSLGFRVVGVGGIVKDRTYRFAVHCDTYAQAELAKKVIEGMEFKP